ncbi:MAG: ABC transporter ATP-binding protein [Spirochaetales bacterium]
MKKIISYAGKNKKFLIWAVITLFISTLIGIIPFLLLNEIIIQFLEKTAVWQSVLALIIGAGIALLLKSVLFGVGLGLSHIGAFNTLFNMRMRFEKDMAHQPMGHIMDEGTGKYKKTFVEDISSLESCLAHMIPEGVPYIFGSIVGIVVVFFADWRLGLATLIMVPISMLPMAYMMKVGLEKMPKYYESRDVLNHSLIEYVSGMEVIKIFNKANKSYSQLENAINAATNFTIEWCRVTWKSCAVLYSLLPCTLLVPLPLGVYLFVNGAIPLSSLTLVIMICLSLSEPLTKLVNFMPSMPMLNFAIEKIEKVFLHEDVQNGEFKGELENCTVNLKNVSFAYGEKDVIKNLSLDVPQNSMCALVGASGSGKSTLAKLLMHFWDVKDGGIFIGNKDIREFTFDNLMKHISYVSQENTLFDGSVFENIAVAKDGISKEEVIAACKKANCHDFIMALSEGYDTNVGTLGGKLSGGERQRITIARAILKNAPIVVLDEATAFADAENEFLIQEALSSLLVNKTVIVIAHKLHTITDVDKIVVLKDGEVDSEGTHKELLKTCQIYQNLWEQNQKSINWNFGGEKNV